LYFTQAYFKKEKVVFPVLTEIEYPVSSTRIQYHLDAQSCFILWLKVTKMRVNFSHSLLCRKNPIKIGMSLQFAVRFAKAKFHGIPTGATDEIYLMEEGQMDIWCADKEKQLDVTLYFLFLL
jgi:hypothetical protein